MFTRDDLIQSTLVEKKRANPPPVAVNKEFSEIKVEEQDKHNSRIKDLFSQMEDKVFNGKVKQYHLFRQFDKDGDGYVSYADFRDSLH